ncbi:outer membrane beta-barrel protein [Sphingopyxis chilensis]
MHISNGFKVLILTTASGLTVPALAQSAPPSLPAAEAAAIGPASGRLDAGLEVAVSYDDNIYVTRNREQDDFYLIVRPSLKLRLGSGDTTLTVRGAGEIARYADLSSEDYDDWSLAGDARTALSKTLSLTGGAEWRWDHESRASPDAVSGIEPTRYQRGFGYLGIIGSSGKLTGRLAGTVTRHDFDDVPGAGVTINNDDRDRLQGEIGARGGVRVTSGTELFVQGAFDWRDYDLQTDDAGYRRKSEGLNIAAGVRRKLSDAWSAELFAGWIRRDYRDPRLLDVDGWDIGAVLDWTGDKGLGGSFRLDRSVEETTLPGASGYIATSGRLALRADVGPRLTAGIGLSGSHYDYVGADRSEFVIGGDLWVRQWLSRHIYLGVDYSHAERSSNAAGSDYDQNRFRVSLGVELRPRHTGDAPRVAWRGAAPGGAYVGLLASHATLITGIDGPRGPGSNTADFGDMGGGVVAVAGYGVLAGRLYLGIEAEAALAGPDWQHSADRVFSMSKDNAVGLSARAGWATPHSDLIYTRFGITSTRFGTEYAHDASAYSQAERRTGFSAGFGVEARAGRRGFVRAEYLVASHDDFDVPTGDGDFDNFSPNETQFRVGGGIRFGRVAAATEELQSMRFDGAYLGFQIGHGALVTANQGVRSGGTELDVTRASRGGLLGLYGGYGTLIGRGFLGLEAEADISAINWNIDREANGRTYSAEHDYSFGGTARAGLLIGEAALIYARVGALRTRFDIDYATSGLAVRSRETRTGVRYGGGIEVGLGPRARLRLDYTITDYASYDVEYGRNADHFDHSETLFRVGLSWRL